MSIDKFGRYGGNLAPEIKRGPPGKGYKLIDNGDFNITDKRLSNVVEHMLDGDAINVKYMKFNSITLPNSRFDVAMGNICNLSDPEEPFDTVNKIFLGNTTKSYLIDITPIKTTNGYMFKNNRVTDVVPPTHKPDAVNLQYIKIIR